VVVGGGGGGGGEVEDYEKLIYNGGNIRLEESCCTIKNCDHESSAEMIQLILTEHA
jgi:hypothetical protein